MRRVLYLVLVLFLGTFAIACNDDDDDENGEDESVCGDGVCDADEDADSCPEDCDDSGDESVCGDGVCDADEDADSCPEDCDDGDDESVCGDGVCDADEDADSCPEDCDDGGDESVCGDGVCDADEDADSCPEDCDDGGEPQATTCVATYQLEATMAIEGTPLSMGDAVAEDLPGTVTLRYAEDPDNEGAPEDGSPVDVIHWFVRNEIFVDTASVDTKVNAFTPTCNGEENLDDLLDIPDVCDPEGDFESEARASGVFDAGSEALVWDACTFPEEYSEDPQGGGYTPEHQAEGPGCLNGYKSQGNVNCGGGSLCDMGNLEEDDNPQDDEWVQPLEAFTLSADGSSIALERTRIPNGQPSSTYLSFEGERTDVNCE